jgi:Stress responsive A/B Barrel Domain
MHIHIAIFKWKDGVLQEDVDAAMDDIRSVSSRVDGIHHIYCGKNTSKWNLGFTDAVVVIGETAQSIDDYRADAVHERAAKIIDSMELEGIGIDFSDEK